MAIKAEPTFALKGHLFNKTKVASIAAEIAAVYPAFATRQFTTKVTAKFPELELMERLYWIRDCLREFLPSDYQAAVKILLESLPPPCDPTLVDGDFGDFIYGPYGAFVAEYGCNQADLQFSLQALQEMTTRFSAEFPIRTFINAFPKETLAFLQTCTTNKHYHVRRLASEGSRPKLPWAKKVAIDYRDPLPLLTVLYSDQTRFVTRSVANHMNDISKLDPKLTVATLKRWRASGLQSDKEMRFIIRHSLRTLEKQGNTAALQLLGYGSQALQVSDFVINTPRVQIGDALEFAVTVRSTALKSQTILLDYHLYFHKANGELAPKTFKIAKTQLAPGEVKTFIKRQPLRPMTTRTLHPGIHAVELQVNGQVYPRKEFTLQTSQL